jgi:hypothetical protein
MSRPHLLISAAWLLNGGAWFLPVVTSVFGGKIGPPIKGAEAFLMSVSAFWPGQFGTWYGALLAGLSALTTVFFLVGSPWAVMRGTSRLQRSFAWIAGAAFLVNTHWYFQLTPNGWMSGLGIGYFLWWLSFAVLAVGLFDLAGPNNVVKSTHAQAALLPR